MKNIDKKTNISKNHNVKANAEAFDQRPALFTFRVFVVFSKSKTIYISLINKTSQIE